MEIVRKFTWASSRDNIDHIDGVSQYELKHPGSIYRLLEIVEGVAYQLALKGTDWTDFVHRNYSEFPDQLRTSIVTAAMEFREKIDGIKNSATDDPLMDVRYSIWRQLAATILENEQRFFGHSDIAEGYRFARSIVTKNQTPIVLSSDRPLSGYTQQPLALNAA